ncbi:hypothetical protein ColTof4_13568 [Colletotrichum tofieldiae]|nr:hypothetical protein ColTof4_13568 [Colletotrichum tofieldiae]
MMKPTRCHCQKGRSTFMGWVASITRRQCLVDKNSVVTMLFRDVELRLSSASTFHLARRTVSFLLDLDVGLVVSPRTASAVACVIFEHRRLAGRKVVLIDPATSGVMFDALDWIVAVATWIAALNACTASARDDVFRTSAMQLLAALIADVFLSGHTDH